MQGDSFHFAFAHAREAVTAATEAQDALASHQWETEPIRVRIGIHTGEPVAHEGLYAGLDVHRAARVMQAGHGGQVLVSETTKALVGDEFPLRELGTHRLKDLTQPQRLYQLGDGEFPLLKTLDATNLPVAASPLIGRERELSKLLSLVADGSRLVTVTGPGGTGKTRLALQAAAELVGSFADGIYWVPLAGLSDSELVLPTIAQTLGITGDLSEYARDRQLLLLLDSAEHVLGAAPQLGALLSSSPELRLLVTSRVRLQLSAELEYALEPLRDIDAVTLFVERARAIGRELEPDETVAAICRSLDRLPLALELASARTKSLEPKALLARLEHALPLLTGGSKDAPERQRTLRATIDWSYELLSESEQALFRRLAVFVGGCTLEGAEEVAGADLDSLQSLVEKSLLRLSTNRYWMLETIREYAAERLAESGELEESKQRHVDFVVRLASQLEAVGAADEERNRFHLEQDNFRAALAWAEHGHRTDAQLELISRSWPFWWYRGHSGEGLRWVESALAHSEGERSGRRARVLAAGAMFAYRHGKHGALRNYAEESLAIARELGDTRNTIWPLIFLALWASEVGTYDEATDLYEEAIAVARKTGDRKLVGIALNNLGAVALNQGDFVRATPFFEEAREISRELRTPDEAALETINLAFCFHQTGRSGEAVAAVKEGLALAREVKSLTSLEYAFVLLGALECRRGDANIAARLLGVAEVLRDRVGDHVADDAKLLETTITELVSALGEERYATALAEGRAMSLDKAVDYALSSVAEPQVTPRP